MNALVTIIDDDEPGEVGFLEEHLQISVLESQGFVDVPVTRQNGSAGAIKIKYTTVDGSAIAGKDYTHMSDEIEFQRGQITKMLRIPITVDQRYELEETFKVNLEFVSGPPRATLCERHSSTITITSDEKTKELCDKVAALVNLTVDKYKVGGSNYAQQFKDALLVNGGDDDEDDGPPGTMAYVMHFLTLPWKLIYALVPPTDYLGGKLCFGIALAFIGVTTIFIADLASMFGCSIGLKPAMCAITFVALGTSLPDTFASQAAAIGDDTADAAVGNVTGSNSVNVFLGLGLPWLIAAVYWAIDGGGETPANILWDSIYGCWDNDLSAWREGSSPRAELKDYAKDFSPDGRTFIVPSGALGVSVGIFSICALTCLKHSITEGSHSAPARRRSRRGRHARRVLRPSLARLHRWLRPLWQVSIRGLRTRSAQFRNTTEGGAGSTRRRCRARHGRVGRGGWEGGTGLRREACAAPSSAVGSFGIGFSWRVALPRHTGDAAHVPNGAAWYCASRVGREWFGATRTTSRGRCGYRAGPGTRQGRGISVSRRGFGHGIMARHRCRPSSAGALALDRETGRSARRLVEKDEATTLSQVVHHGGTTPSRFRWPLAAHRFGTARSRCPPPANSRQVELRDRRPVGTP